MKKFTLYIGLNDKETKSQEISTLDAYKIASNVFVEKTGGATITEGKGIYTHDDGTVVVENTLICVVFGVDRETIIDTIGTLKVVFNQEAIALETMEIESEFI